MRRLLAVASVAATMVTGCGDLLPQAAEIPVVSHDSEVDEAIAETMADYYEASGGLYLDRIRCDEYREWNSVIATSARLGLDTTAAGHGSVAAMGGELTEFTCLFGREWFATGGGEFSASVVHVMLLRGAPRPLQNFHPVHTPAGLQVLAGVADLYDLGGWRHPDLDDTVAVAASVGDTHSVLVAVRVQVSDTSAALALLDAAWVDLGLPE